MKTKHKKQKGFTIIELLVITGILVLCGGLIASIIFNTLRGSRKSTNTNSVAQSGNYALSAITDVVNKSDSVVSLCNNDSSAQSIELYSSSTNSKYLISCGTGITITRLNPTTNVSVAPPTNLLNSNVRLTTGTCSIKCGQVAPTVTGAASPNPFMKPLVVVSFSLTDPDQSTAADVHAQANFKTSILLRNYEP